MQNYSNLDKNSAALLTVIIIIELLARMYH